MKQGSWVSIITIYLFGVLAVAGLGRILPLNVSMHSLFGVSDIQFALIFGLIGFPALLLAIPLGMLVDNIGPKIILIFGACAAITADFLFGTASNIFGLELGRVFDGVAIASIHSSGPALLMASTSGKKQIAAMTLWSTCSPVGFSLGLVVGGNFSDVDHWQNTFLCHGIGFFVVAILAFFILVNTKQVLASAISIKGRIIELIDAYKNVPLLILVLGFFLISSVGFGVNSVLPMYISKAHGIGIHQASQLIAGTNIFMIIGSLSTGALLSRQFSHKKMELLLGVLALFFGFMIFYPKTPMAYMPILLSSWFAITGSSITIILASLPKFSQAGRLGASSGLINQAGAISTMVNPPLWFGLLRTDMWYAYPALILLAFLGINITIWTIYTNLERQTKSL